MSHCLLSLPGTDLLVENFTQPREVMGHVQNYMGESKVSMHAIESVSSLTMEGSGILQVLLCPEHL